MDLSFSVHKLAEFSSNTGKVHFEVLVHLLRYIRENQTLGLNYYVDMKDAPLSDLLRQARIKTEHQLMTFSDFSWQNCTDTVRSIVEYIIFYQGGKIDHGTHVPVPVAESSSESDYNAAPTAITALSHFRMLIHEFLNKYIYIVPEEDTLTILDIKSAVCMDKNRKYTKHTRHTAIRVHFVRNGVN